MQCVDDHTCHDFKLYILVFAIVPVDFDPTSCQSSVKGSCQERSLYRKGGLSCKSAVSSCIQGGKFRLHATSLL